MAEAPSTIHHVTTIIVAHDGAAWIPKVVAALSVQTRPFDRSIAIDTDSHDDSAKLLRASGFTTVTMSRGTGFGDAIEEALKKLPSIKKVSGQDNSTEKIIEWLWLIHDDCAPKKNALGELLKAVESRPTVAIAGPKILGWNDRNHILEMGVSIAPNGARWTGMEYREQDQGQHDGNKECKEVLAVSTAGALIRRDVYEELGGLDPELSLFRDDVDFGWRARTAGHSVIAVANSVVYHAEAAASERRSVDVSEAFLRRPLLLDRRNAAYVLLANASWWWIPFITIQVLFSSIVRAIGYLIAKLPGYAADEIAAVGLLFIKPTKIFDARKQRRKTRLLSSRIIAEYIPPRGSQISLAFERARAAVARYFDRRSAQTGWIIGEPNDEEDKTLPTIDLGSEENDDEFVDDEQFTRLKAFFSRPIYTFTLLIVLLTVIASRHRVGDIAGGILSPIPASGIDLLRKYTESWHTVSQGSSASASPWLFLLGLASVITLGNLKLLISALFLFIVPIIFVLTYKYARSMTKNRAIALCGAALISLSPALLNSISNGAFATIVIALITPFYASTLLNRDPSELPWQRTFFLAMCDAFVFFFSPLLFVAITCWQLIRALPNLYIRLSNPELRQYALHNDLAKLATLIITPLIVAFPWSFTLMRHPSRFLIEPGLQIPTGETLAIVFGNPGGESGVPQWIIAPTLIIALIALFSSSTRIFGEFTLFMIGFALIATIFPVAGHGNFNPESPYTGSVLLLATFTAVIAAVKLGDRHIPQLSQSHVGFRHLLTLATAIVATGSLFATATWWVTSGANSLVRSNHTSPLPAFVSASGDTPERYKTLVVSARSGSITYFIARDKSLELGDADPLYDVDPLINQSIADLVTGIGVTSSQVFGNFGIRYLFLANPVDPDLVRTIDGIGGFVRSSATRDGISWKIPNAKTRITVKFRDGSQLGIPSGAIGAKTIVPGAGTITIAEKFDGKWKLLFNGQAIPIERSSDGYPMFTVPGKGVVQIFHDGTQRRALISLQCIAIFVLVILAAPSGRRRKEVPIEELA